MKRPDDVWRDEDADRDYRRENPSQVLFDEALSRAARAECEPEAVTCRGCGREIDPDICWCGMARRAHSNPMEDGHPFVPLGCDCYRQATAIRPFDGRGSCLKCGVFDAIRDGTCRSCGARAEVW